MIGEPAWINLLPPELSALLNCQPLPPPFLPGPYPCAILVTLRAAKGQQSEYGGTYAVLFTPRALPVKLSPCRPTKRASTLGNLLYLEPGILRWCTSHPGIVMKIHRLQNLDPGPLGSRLHAPDPLLHRGLGVVSRLD